MKKSVEQLEREINKIEIQLTKGNLKYHDYIKLENKQFELKKEVEKIENNNIKGN